MNRPETNYIRKLKKEVVIPASMDDRLENIYEQIRKGKIRMKDAGPKIQQNRSSRRNTLHGKAAAGSFCSSRGNAKHTAWKWTAAAAVCTVFLLSGLCFANPAFAKDLPVLGDIFERLLEHKANSIIGDKDQTALESIAEHSVPVDETEDTAENDIGLTNRAEDAGIVMTVSDAYCDGLDLYFTFSVQTEDPEMNQADYLFMLRYEEEDPVPFGNINASINGHETDVRLLADVKSGDGTFSALSRISSSDLTEEMLAEEMTVDLEINGVGAHKTETISDTMAGYKTIRGNWKLRFRASMDTSHNQTAEIHAEQNGFRIEEVVQTPSNTHVKCAVPAEWTGKSLVFLLVDGSGNRIHPEYASSSLLDDGSSVYEISLYQSTGDQLTLQVYDKNGTAQNPGDIQMPLLAEIPFDMAQGAESD